MDINTWVSIANIVVVVTIAIGGALFVDRRLRKAQQVEMTFKLLPQFQDAFNDLILAVAIATEGIKKDKSFDVAQVIDPAKEHFNKVVSLLEIFSPKELYDSAKTLKDQIDNVEVGLDELIPTYNDFRRKCRIYLAGKNDIGLK